jgi:hypothetical protein
VNAALQQLAYVGGIAALVIFAIGIVCIAFAERGAVDQEEDGTPSEASGGLRPEESERPAIPKAVIVHLSFVDRVALRSMTAQEIEDGRQAWEAYKARMDAIRKVEQGEAQ